LFGVVHLTFYPINYLSSVSLIAPNGTTFPIPLPFNGNAHNDVPFQTNMFDNMPIAGNWTMQVQPAGSPYSGTLDGWEIDAKSIPTGPPPPPPPPPGTVDFPSMSFSWSSQNASGCTASNGWTGTEPTTGTMTFKEPFDGTYTLTCGSGTRSLTISTH
jgi:hypothetical protein